MFFFVLACLCLNIEAASATNPSINPLSTELRAERKAALDEIRDKAKLEMLAVREESSTGGKVFANEESGGELILVEYTSPITGKKKYKYQISE